MSLDRLTAVRRISEQVLDLAPDERVLAVRRLAAGDASLERTVLGLLALMRDTDAGSDDPSDDAGDAEPAPASESLIGAMIGPYRVIRRLGLGGMGAVYEAQHADTGQSVALKIVRPGLSRREVRRRFELEREMLVQLGAHPNIARIYNAGAFDLGFGNQLYFAMELIDGPDLAAWARDRAPAFADQIQLIARVADGVHHAHRKGIIHRDLKPSNILVDERGPEPEPKIVDFGIARFAARNPASADPASNPEPTLVTAVGELVGTMAYMAPEQTVGDPAAVDTAADIYALGVVLYELLAGRLPYDAPRHDLLKLIDAIRTQDPPPLPALDSAVRTDIEIIVRKALRKERGERYASADQFAADLRRVLRDEPISARPPSTFYLLTRAARRNRPAFFAAAAVLLALVVGLVSVSIALRRVRMERDRADGLLWAVAEAGAAWIEHFDWPKFRASLAPAQTPTDPVALIDTAMILPTIAAVEQDSADQPEVLATIRDGAARFYRNHNRPDRAESLYRSVIDLRRAQYPHHHPDTAVAISNLAYFFLRTNRYAEAEPLAAQAVSVLREVDDPRWEPDRAAMLDNLGAIRTELGDLRGAETALREALSIRRSLDGDDSWPVAVHRHSLARCLLRQGRFAEAEDFLLSATASLPLTAERAEIRAFAAEARTTLARLLLETKRAEEAETLLAASHPILEAAPDRARALRASLETQALLYDATNRPEAAAAVRAKLTSDR